MPKNFINGGYVFSASVMFGSLLLTLYCAKLLLDTRAKVGGSFSEIGERTWGRTGKLLFDITLVVSQVSFVTAYVYFIAKNVSSIIT
jgi:proton-coupled amino acid transporter